MEDKEKNMIIFAKEILFIFKGLFISLIATSLYLCVNYFYYIPQYDRYIEMKKQWDINEKLRCNEKNRQNTIDFENALKEYNKKSNKRTQQRLAEIKRSLKEGGSLDDFMNKPDYSYLLTSEPMPRLHYEYKLRYSSYEEISKLSTNIWFVSMMRNPIDNLFPIFIYSCVLFIGWKYLFYIFKSIFHVFVTCYGWVIACYRWIIEMSKKDI